MPEIYDELKSEYDQMTTQRGPWESRWQELRELIHPEGQDFNRRGTHGEIRSEAIYEGTAPWACELFASGLGANFTPKSRRFADFTIKNYDYSRDRAVLEWLEYVTDLVFHHYALPESNYYSAHHEVYLELGSVGTGVLLQEWDWKSRHLVFRSFPLGDVWFKEDDMGQVNCIFRKVCWTTQQVLDHFSREGDVIPKMINEEERMDKVWEIIHAVKPRHHRNVRMFDTRNKPYASVWFCVKAKGVLRDSGMDHFPYFTPRWFKKSGEVYGRGPGHTCLPDIRMINSMEKTQIRSAQKQADPPLIVPSDGFMLPLRTSPSSLLFYDETTTTPEGIKPLETRGRYDIGEDKMSQKREHIMRCFYADWFSRQKKKERQTAAEIYDDRQEMLSLMGPNLARLETELLSAELYLSFKLLDDAGLIPEPPDVLRGQELSLSFSSPAAKAQISNKSLNSRRWMAEEVIPIAQIEPSVLKIINFEEYMRESSIDNGISRKVIHTEEEVAAMREQEEQMAQAEQMAQVAQPAAQALKDVATAQEKGSLI